MKSSLLLWVRTLLIIGGSLAIYVAAALLVGRITGDAVAGAAFAAVIVTVLALGYRRATIGSFRSPAPNPFARSGLFWTLALAALICSWHLGEGLASRVEDLWGSAGAAELAETKLASPVWLLIVTVLVLAPVGEEALFRGIVYPALRARLPILLSALVSASLFAIMHGNTPQFVLVFTFGIVLALVYEITQRLWPVIVMHIFFNLTSSFAPRVFEDQPAGPLSSACWLALTMLSIWALLRGCAMTAAPAADHTGSEEPEGVRGGT